MHDVNAFLPDSCAALDAAELAREQGVKAVKVVFCPTDTGAGHDRRKTLLVDANGVLDQREVDVGDLKNVEWEVSLEDTGTAVG